MGGILLQNLLILGNVLDEFPRVREKFNTRCLVRTQGRPIRGQEIVT